MGHDAARQRRLKRQLQSTVIHFDYDCFYASVVEAENPEYKTLPLAIQQKQIVVTCNYEARKRGLYKLMLIREARKVCPDVIIVLGEDLTRFRNASKLLYNFLRAFSWNNRVERLGFDEVFMDVSDIVDYNLGLVNYNNLADSFFCLSKDNPTHGFQFNAAVIAGQTFPKDPIASLVHGPLEQLQLRLHLASHLAKYLRDALHDQTGYTCAVGISTNKLLSKLVGNVHKPNNQTTLLPPYASDTGDDNVTTFIDNHEIGKIPGIGFKLAQKIRVQVLQRPADFDAGLVYGGTKEHVLVSHVRNAPKMGPELLEQILAGPGAAHGIGGRVWDLINGCDDAEVKVASEVPKQISIEDSYLRLDSLLEVTREMHALAKSLIERMHEDLVEESVVDEDSGQSRAPSGIASSAASNKHWIAYPRTLRLTTRPRPPQNPDGSRNRSFARISRSAPMPSFIFHLLLKEESTSSTTSSVNPGHTEDLAARLVQEAFMPLFRKLHPEKSGWNLSLVNVAVTNMVTVASGSGKGGAEGRDIGSMFRRQGDVLREWNEEIGLANEVVDFEARGEHEDEGPDHGKEDYQDQEVYIDTAISDSQHPQLHHTAPHPGFSHQTWSAGSEDVPSSSQALSATGEHGWQHDESDEESIDVDDTFRCHVCGAVMPVFAVAAHARWHEGG